MKLKEFEETYKNYLLNLNLFFIFFPSIFLLHFLSFTFSLNFFGIKNSL